MARLSTGARLRASLLTAAFATATLIGSAASASVAAPAHADGSSSSSTWDAKAKKVLSWASEQRGKPYRYGSAGPSAFDCSGLVLYVFKNSVGRSLAHNAAEQYRQSKHIRKTSLRVGDLVFVKSGGGISHVGIYAGDGYWWVAPHSGTHVQRQKIYSATLVYGTLTH
jgi:cell wall-associated NlpC family hydrolase